jgi:hypothetical protein
MTCQQQDICFTHCGSNFTPRLCARENHALRETELTCAQLQFGTHRTVADESAIEGDGAPVKFSDNVEGQKRIFLTLEATDDDHAKASVTPRLPSGKEDLRVEPGLPRQRCDSRLLQPPRLGTAEDDHAIGVGKHGFQAAVGPRRMPPEGIRPLPDYTLVPPMRIVDELDVAMPHPSRFRQCGCNVEAVYLNSNPRKVQPPARKTQREKSRVRNTATGSGPETRDSHELDISAPMGDLHPLSETDTWYGRHADDREICVFGSESDHVRYTGVHASHPRREGIELMDD